MTENVNFEINPLSLLLDRKKTPNNLQIHNAVLFVKNKFKVLNDEQNKFNITIFDLLPKNAVFSISNMSLKVENEGTISYYDIDILRKNQIIRLVFMGKIMIGNKFNSKFDFIYNTAQIIQALIIQKLFI